jgi:hypothetical protein
MSNERKRVTYGDMMLEAAHREAVKQMWIDRLKIVFFLSAIACAIKWMLS